MEKKIKEIKEILKSSYIYREFETKLIETKFSLTIVVTDYESSYEEVATIDKSTGDTHFVIEGVEYEKKSIDRYLSILRENFGEANSLDNQIRTLRNKLYHETVNATKDKKLLEYLKKEFNSDWSKNLETIKDALLDSIGS